MYWIEVLFTNGKTLRKETNNINDNLKVLVRYQQYMRKPAVQKIRSGFEGIVTGEWCLIKDIVI